MTKKEAFKLGFVAKLAAHGVAPSQMIDAALLLEKRGFNPVPLVATGIGLGTAVPFYAGKGVGALGTALQEEDVEESKTTRRRFLLKQLRDLIEARKAERENALIAQAKRNVRGA